MTRNRKESMEIYPDLRSRKQENHDPTPELVRFLIEHGPFAAKVAQINLKGRDKCTCDSE